MTNPGSMAAVTQAIDQLAESTANLAQVAQQVLAEAHAELAEVRKQLAATETERDTWRSRAYGLAGPQS